MVNALRRFGIDRTVDQVWDCVTAIDPFGTQAARTYLLAAYARTCGLDAAVLQCRPDRGWRALQFCAAAELTVILNHQAVGVRGEGHYTVMLAITDKQITLRDPFLKTPQTVDRELFLTLWRPNVEIAGDVLIAIDSRSVDDRASGNDRSMECPGCKAPLNFAPQAIFDSRHWNPAGLWKRFFCLGCDASFSPQAIQPAAGVA